MQPVNRVEALLALQMNGPMARRPRQPKRHVTTYLPTDLHDTVRDYSDATGVPIARIIEDALRDYLNKVDWSLEEDETEGGAA
jgi:hypothetical protein